jgi:hypothetical protein
MVQIRRDSTDDFICTHGGQSMRCRPPAHDSGSAACEVCNMIMMKWVDSAIPLFRAKKNIEDTALLFFPRSKADQPGDGV